MLTKLAALAYLKDRRDFRRDHRSGRGCFGGCFWLIGVIILVMTAIAIVGILVESMARAPFVWLGLLVVGFGVWFVIRRYQD